MRHKIGAVVVVFVVTAAACSETTSATRPVGDQATTAHVEQVVAEPDVPAGLALFRSVGCAACHGDDGEGNIGPAMAGHTAEQVFRQVRTPKGDVMPPFPETELTESDLEEIVEWVVSLGGEGVAMDHAGGHEGGPELSLTEAGHLRLVLESLAANNLSDATHHTEHLLVDAGPDVAELAERLLADLQSEDLHDAQEQIETALGPEAAAEFDAVAVHLGMAIAASQRVDPEDVDHHLESAAEAAADHDHGAQMQELLARWRAGEDRHGIVHSMYELLGLEHTDPIG